MALKKCKSCGNTVDSSARSCPHCGAYRWTTGRIGCAIYIVPFILLFAYFYFQSYGQYSNKSNVTRSSTPGSKPRATSDQTGFQSVPAGPPTVKSESSTGNVSAPITQSGAPIESITPKHWVTVVEAQGTTDKNTDTFTLHGGKAKLTYSFSKDLHMGIIYVLPEGHVFETQGGMPEVFATKKEITDSTFLIKKAGNYYLKVMSNTSWEVKIEEEIEIEQKVNGRERKNYEAPQNGVVSKKGLPPLEETSRLDVPDDFYGYNINEYCQKVSNAVGGSYIIENSCRRHEQENKNKLNSMQIPSEIRSYCKQLGESVGGSYQITESCVRHEIEAKNKLQQN